MDKYGKDTRYYTKVILSFMVVVSGFFSCGSMAEDITGYWLTYDDADGEMRSVVLITEQDGRLFGRINKVFPRPGNDEKCVKCKGEKYNQDIVGLEIFSDLMVENDVWQGGTILDPENGKEYKCKLWLEGDDLKVRGYIALFYRTQTWKRVSE